MTENTTGRTVLIVALAVFVAFAFAAAVGIGVYLFQARKIGEAEQARIVAEKRLQEALTNEATGTAEDTENPVSEDSAGVEDGSTSKKPKSKPNATVKGETGRNCSLVKKIWTDGGTRFVTLDYVQFLSGAEANAAAAEHGDETPVPNDYYVVNDNPKLRTFPVPSSAKVYLAQPGPGNSVATWAEFKSAHKSWKMYWFTVKNGEVTKIEEQWTP